MKRFTFGMALGAALALGAPAAWGHGSVETIEIGSTADGGGALVTFFHFHERVARLSYSATVGPNSIYTGGLPGMQSLAHDDGPDIYVLDPGTDVSVEITAIDEGISVTINGNTLAAVGDATLLGNEPIGHNHPAWALSFARPAGSFGEGRVSFKLTTTSGSYSESEAYTLTLTNGALGATAYATGAYDKAGVACRQTVAKAGQTFLAKKLSLMRACADKLQALAAKNALTTPPADLAKVQAAAEKACVGASGEAAGKTMLGKIEVARSKAFGAIQKKCAVAAGLSDNDIHQHLGMIACRTDELVGAMYGNARTGMSGFFAQASQGGLRLHQYFPCLKLILAE